MKNKRTRFTEEEKELLTHVMMAVIASDFDDNTISYMLNSEHNNVGGVGGFVYNKYDAIRGDLAAGKTENILKKLKKILKNKKQ